MAVTPDVAPRSDPFVLTRPLAAPPARVFGAWTKAEQLEKWWGPKGFDLLSCTMDLRPGGLFLYGMKAPDGTPMWGRWVFREIAAPDRLVFVVSFSDAQGGVSRHPWAPDWPLEMLTTVTFAPSGSGTLFRMESSALDATAQERATFDAGHASLTQGWTGTMEQLDAYLSKD